MAMCDCCAGELAVRAVRVRVWDEPVVLCSVTCLARLSDVWRPAPPRAWRPVREMLGLAVVGVLMVAQAIWGVF